MLWKKQAADYAFVGHAVCHLVPFPVMHVVAHCHAVSISCNPLNEANEFYHLSTDYC